MRGNPAPYPGRGVFVTLFLLVAIGITILEAVSAAPVETASAAGGLALTPSLAVSVAGIALIGGILAVVNGL